MKIDNINLVDFRAFKGNINFDFKIDNENIADIVVIHAPNGMGKTSFFDAVEWGLKGNIYRLNETISNNAFEGKILKNRYAENDGPAKVEIKCADGSVITRSTNKKSPIRDYSKGSLTDTTGLSDYKDWDKMILPHSKIDGFIAATKPEERFNEWVKFWDPDEKSTKSFKFVVLFMKKISNEIDKVQSKINECDQVIANSELSEELFNSINKSINDLGKTNDVKLINRTDFSNVEKVKIILMQENSKLQTEIKMNRSDVETLSYLISFFNQYIEKKALIEKCNVDEEKTHKLITDFEKYTVKLDLYDSYKLELEKSNKTINKAQKILDADNSWLSKKEKYDNDIPKLVNTKRNLQYLIEKRDNWNNRLSEIEKSTFESHEKMSNYMRIKQNLEKELLNLDVLRKEYEILNNRTISDKKLKDVVTNKINMLEKEMTELNILIIAEDNIEISRLTTSIYLNTVNKLDYNNLLGSLNKIMSLEQEHHKLMTEMNLHESAMSVYEKLTKDAITFISQSKLSTCPICESEFKDVDTLLLQIKGEFPNKGDTLELEEELISVKNMILIEKIELSNHVQIWNLSIRDYFQKCGFKYSELTAELLKLNELIIDDIGKLEFLKNQINKSEEIFADCGIRKGLDLNQAEVDIWYTTNQQYYNDFIKLKNEEHIFLKKELAVLDNGIKMSSGEINEISKAINIFQNDIENIKLLGYYKDLNLEFDISEVRNYYKKLKEENDEICTKIEKSKEDLEKFNFVEPPNIKSLKEEYSKIRLIISDYNSFISKYENKKALLFADGTINSIILENMKSDLSIVYDALAEKQTLLNYSLDLIEEAQIEKYIMKSVENKIIYKQKNEELKNAFAKVEKTYSRLKQNFKEHVSVFFENTLSNEIFSKIEVHPIMNQISFDIDISDAGKPLLKISVENEEANDKYLPEWFFSSAQLNALALSLFLSEAVTNDKAPIKTIFIDDPIGHFDDINVISFVDLIRSLVETSKYQIVMSTHEEGIYKLMKMKLSDNHYKSKFIDLKELLDKETVIAKLVNPI